SAPSHHRYRGLRRNRPETNVRQRRPAHRHCPPSGSAGASRACWDSWRLCRKRAPAPRRRPGPGWHGPSPRSAGRRRTWLSDRRGGRRLREEWWAQADRGAKSPQPANPAASRGPAPAGACRYSTTDKLCRRRRRSASGEIITEARRGLRCTGEAGRTDSAPPASRNILVVGNAPAEAIAVVITAATIPVVALVMTPMPIRVSVVVRNAMAAEVAMPPAPAIVANLDHTVPLRVGCRRRGDGTGR